MKGGLRTGNMALQAEVARLKRRVDALERKVYMDGAKERITVECVLCQKKLRLTPDVVKEVDGKVKCSDCLFEEQHNREQNRCISKGWCDVRERCRHWWAPMDWPVVERKAAKSGPCPDFKKLAPEQVDAAIERIERTGY